MMKNNIKLLVILLGFVVPYILIYRAFFVSGPLAFGDAPYFYPENLKELLNLPFLWNFKDNNFGAPQYYILWLYIPTFLYGVLNNTLGLGNDFLIRLIFYFPATVLAIFGAWKFIGKFTSDLWGKFLGAFLYGFNTYFLMLLDGGQMGVALAYGIFPLTAFYLLNFLSSLNIRTFVFALVSLFALVSADVRIALILIFFVVLVGAVGGITRVNERFFSILKGFFVLGLSVAGLSGYWIVPSISSGLGGLERLDGLGEGANFISLSNALFLFQPHFPLNQFGMILPIPFYFAFVPILIFGVLLWENDKPRRKFTAGLSLLFLIFVFLAKGGSEPLGGIYLWLVENIPLGISFRDSSKFYMPLLLMAGLLLSFTVGSLSVYIKGKWHVLVTVLIYGFLLGLISPAVLGNLTGVLGKINNEPYLQLYQKLNEGDEFARSLWFRERPPLAFADWEKPAISADQLVNERPFASMNTGKFDYFNFLHSPQVNSWFNLLGIKYILLPGDERKKIWTQEDLEGKKELFLLVGSLPGLYKLDGLTFPAYQLDNVKPHIFAQKKAVFVVGGEDIYTSLNPQKDHLGSQGFVFLEEGRVDPRVLDQVDSDAASLVFLGKEQIDLQMTFLQDKMMPIETAVLNQWQRRASGDYLTWRYDLLKQGIESREFDFGRGVAFSTVTGEKVKFELSIPEKSNYYLGLRYTNATTSAGLKIVLPGIEKNVLNKYPEKFRWEIFGPFMAEKGKLQLSLTNQGGFVMLNTLALTTEKDFLEAGRQASEAVGKFRKIEVGEKLEENFLPVKATQINPTEYKIEDIPQDARWLVFSDHYNPGWRFKSGDSLNLPFYAMINGLYLPEKAEGATLYFLPQKEVGKGILVSAISLGLIILGLLYFRSRGKN